MDTYGHMRFGRGEEGGPRGADSKGNLDIHSPYAILEYSLSQSEVGWVWGYQTARLLNRPEGAPWGGAPGRPCYP